MAPRAKKTEPKAPEPKRVEEEEPGDGTGEEEESDADIIAPLFDDAPSPVLAERIDHISLKRKNGPQGVYEYVPEGVVDRRTNEEFQYNPFETKRKDIGYVYGPGCYQATPFDENNRVVGARYEFVISNKQVASAHGSHVPPPGIETPMGGGRNDEEDEEEEEEEEDEDDRRGGRGRSAIDPQELAAAMRGGGSSDDLIKMLLGHILAEKKSQGQERKGPSTAREALEIAEVVLGTRGKMGVDPTSEGMLKRLEKQNEQAIAEMRANAEAARKDHERRESELTRQITEWQRKFDNTVDQLGRDNRDAISTLKKEHEKAIEDLREDFKRRNKERDKEEEERRDEARRRLREAEDRAKEDRDRARQTEDDLRSRGRSSDDSREAAERRWNQRFDEETKRVRDEADRRIEELRSELDSARRGRRDDATDLEKHYGGKVKDQEKEINDLRKTVHSLELKLAAREYEDDDEEEEDDTPRPNNAAGGVESLVAGLPKPKNPILREIVTSGAAAIGDAVMRGMKNNGQTQQGLQGVVQQQQRVQYPVQQQAVQQAPVQQQAPVYAPAPAVQQPAQPAPVIRATPARNANVPAPPPPGVGPTMVQQPVVVAQPAPAPASASEDPVQGIQVVETGRRISAIGGTVFELAPEEDEGEEEDEEGEDEEGEDEEGDEADES